MRVMSQVYEFKITVHKEEPNLQLNSMKHLSTISVALKRFASIKGTRDQAVASIGTFIEANPTQVVAIKQNKISISKSTSG